MPESTQVTNLALPNYNYIFKITNNNIGTCIWKLKNIFELNAVKEDIVQLYNAT